MTIHYYNTSFTSSKSDYIETFSLLLLRQISSLSFLYIHIHRSAYIEVSRKVVSLIKQFCEYWSLTALVAIVETSSNFMNRKLTSHVLFITLYEYVIV